MKKATYRPKFHAMSKDDSYYNYHMTSAANISPLIILFLHICWINNCKQLVIFNTYKIQKYVFDKHLNPTG